MGVGVFVQGIKTWVGVSVGARVLVGPGVLVGGSGVAVLVGTTGVLVGAFRVRLATTVCAACVETDSKVGFVSTVGTGVDVAGAAVGAALQPASTATRISPTRVFHTNGLEYIRNLLDLMMDRRKGIPVKVNYKTVYPLWRGYLKNSNKK